MIAAQVVQDDRGINVLSAVVGSRPVALSGGDRGLQGCDVAGDDGEDVEPRGATMPAGR
jgi:hypothetical protein